MMSLTSESMHPQYGSVTGGDLDDDESYIEESKYNDDDGDDELSCFSIGFVDDGINEVIITTTTTTT